ncbi:MAG: DUF3298 domain-containing protein [Peptococcaceae bacterium]|nr:DUF3298 domain-containing protein [Peptococcaceae bacterium]
MNRQEQLDMLKKEYNEMEVPEEALEALQRGIQKAKQEKQAGLSARMRQKDNFRKAGWQWKSAVRVVAAASVLALLIVPNVNPKIAEAVADVPVLNKVIDLVTIHHYQEEAADEKYAASVKTPELTAKGDAQLQSSVGEINAEVVAYADRMIEQFQQEMEQQGGVYGLDITYNVVTDSEEWFALQINTVETMAGGAETVHYYNLDKISGRYVLLADLFREDADYVAAISENIKEQMAQRMEADENVVYDINCELPEDNFQQIAENQTFYQNQNGQLVIVFNEYEVAPGFMGCPEFVIGDAVLKPLLAE